MFSFAEFPSKHTIKLHAVAMIKVGIGEMQLVAHDMADLNEAPYLVKRGNILCLQTIHAVVERICATQEIPCAVYLTVVGGFLEHLILSHHGQPEFGAAVLPQCAEAELLSLVDQIDSRMEIYREVLAPLKAGEFSQRVFALDNRRIYKHQ